MDAHRVARWAAASERTTAMAETRRCIGSARFAIEPHDAPIEEFPKQPSQKDGLGRMCKAHWNQYTKALARASKARKAAAEGEAAAPTAESTNSEEIKAVPSEPAAKRTRKAVPVPVDIGDGQEGDG
jgi:hypothetical protein